MNNIISEIRGWFGLFTIPKNHRLPLLLAFLTGVLAYAIFIFHHLLDGHGLPNMPWIDTTWWGPTFGRWTSSLIVALGYNADIPVLNALIGVLFLLLSGYYMFQIASGNQGSNLEIYLIISLIVTFPINLSFFYYTYSTTHFTASIFFAVVAARSLTQGTWIGFLFGFIFLLLMWTTYQASIGVFLVLMLAFWISALFQNSPKIPDNKGVFPEGIWASIATSVIALISSAVIYAIIFKLFSTGPGHASSISIQQLPALWMAATISAFQHLWFSQPDFHKLIKIITAGTVFSAFVGSLWMCRKNWGRFLLLLILWPCCLLSTKAIFYLVKAEFPFFEYRLNAALGFFYAFAFTVVFVITKRNRWLYSLCVVIACFTLLRFVQADLVRQIVNKRGETHDLALANRILSRIEALEGLDPWKEYQIVRIGEFPRHNWVMLTNYGKLQYDRSGDSHMDWDPITAKWVPQYVFKYLGARVKLLNDDYPERRRAKFAEKYLLSDKDPYPADGSIFLFGDTIYVYLEKDAQTDDVEFPPNLINFTKEFEKISHDSWLLSNATPSQSNSLPICWYAIAKEKDTKNKEFIGFMSLESDRDLEITALLCSHDSAYEGTTKNFKIKANKKININVKHRFKENSSAVKFQLNVVNAPDKLVNLKMRNIFIGEYP
jgi:hypothetical protein